MLPSISLDNDRFSSIIDDARNRIVSLYPEWTDFNYHDPGITMLELFSWIKESQQFYLDQVGDENHKKYLKLLGLRRRSKVPSLAEVELTADRDIDVLKGTKFYAGDTCFEAVERRNIFSGGLASCITFEGEKARVMDRRQLDFGGKAKMWIFGREPKEGSCFYLGFANALPKDIVHRALFDLYDGYEIQRAPIIDPTSFYPLAETVLERYTNEGWQPVSILSDETCAFLRSGSIHFRVEQDMALCTVGGNEGYYIRFRLVGCGYDVPPVIQRVCFNSIQVRQRDTQSEVIDLPSDGTGKCSSATELSVNGVSQLFVQTGDHYYLIDKVTKRIDYDHNRAVFELNKEVLPAKTEGLRLINTTGAFANSNFVGFGTGLPFQEIELNRNDVEYESFELMIEDPDEENCFLDWKKVNDFAASTPEDRHYVFDSAKGVIRFGDCFNGLAPEGSILIAGYATTMGTDGNVKGSTINRIGAEDISGIAVLNPDDAFGGEDEETLDACFQRARRMLKKPLTAVTHQDYEECVRKTPGLMIESCKVIAPNRIRTKDNAAADITIRMVVKPFWPENAEHISEAYARNIENHMRHFRLLGTRIELIVPEYVGVTIYADLALKPHYRNGQEIVEKAIADFFGRYKDRFGAEVVYSELYGVIDRLDCVSYVGNLSLEAKGNGIARTKEGNIILQPNGVVYLSGKQFMFSVDQ